MRLVRIGEPGQERPAVLVSDELAVDISDLTADLDPDYWAGLDVAALSAYVDQRAAAGDVVSVVGQRFGPPITRPHQLLCIGLNYADHAAESGMAVPTEPIVFNKAPNTLVGPNDDVVVPRGSTKTDWEVELGVVIGRRCRYLESPADAWAHIAGFVLVNDVSERAFQLERGGQWVKGKSCETFNPCGPWLLTRDEIGDVQDLGMWLDVNGVRRQTGSTRTMIFDVRYLVWYLSQFMVLEPGDLIDTGTPPGVGMGLTPPTFLRAGDVMALGIDHLGTQRQRLVAAD